MPYRVSGQWKTNKNVRSFIKEIEAPSEKAAQDIVYALFGSKNRIKRSRISISGIEKI